GCRTPNRTSGSGQPMPSFPWEQDLRKALRRRIIAGELLRRWCARSGRPPDAAQVERIEAGLQWDSDLRHYDRVIANSPGQQDRAFNDLAAELSSCSRPLVTISGASGVGKGTLIDRYYQSGQPREKVVLCTSRQ